jgi:PAS domain S-box-containing protein
MHRYDRRRSRHAGDAASPPEASVAVQTASGPHAPASAPPDEAVALYRAIFANSTEPIAIIDPSGAYLEQNAAHEALLGYSAEELRGRTPAVHFGEAMFREIAEELSRGGRCRREVTSRTKDGRTIEIELSAFAVRNAAGEPLCYVGIKRDVTERKRSAAELARRLAQLQVVYGMTDAVGRAGAVEEIYEEALNGLQQAVRTNRASVLLFDDDGVMRFKAWRGLSDAYRRAVEGHSPWSRDTRDPQPIVVADVGSAPELAGLLPAIRAEGIGAMGFIPLVYDGRLLGKFMIYFEGPHEVAPDELLLAQTIAGQIAFAIARRLSAEALRESEDRYRRLVEVCPVAVAVHSDGRFDFVNPAAARLVGAERAEELVGRAMLDFVHADDHDLVRERMRQLREGAGQVPPVEERFVRLDGSVVDVEVVSTRFTFQGRPAVQMVARDVTERKRDAEALAGAKLAAEEANRAKSQFLATMSHELRTPLNAVAGYTELLATEVRGPVTAAQREDLRRIQVNARHLLGLINDVLNFAKVEAGHLELEVTSVPVEETLSAAHTLIDPQLRAKGLTYEYGAGDAAVTCRADREKLQQIVLNLLSNAVKFTDRGGHVSLWWEAAGPEVRVHVRDTGVGVPPDKLEAIFEPFVQLHRGLAQRTDGTGLGLAISRELARAMRGDVTVASAPGQGATFTLTLPR